MLISKESFVNFVNQVPLKVSKEAIFNIEGDRLNILGQARGVFRAIYNLSVPINDIEEGLEPFGMLLTNLSRISKIEDDMLSLKLRGGNLVVTGNTCKDRSYKLPTSDIASCPSYINYRSSHETLLISLEKGFFQRSILETPVKNKKTLYDKEVLLPEVMKARIIAEGTPNECMILLSFRPVTSTMFIEDSSSQIFSKFSFTTPIDFEYDLLVNPEFLYIIKLLKGDVSVMLSGEDDPDYQLANNVGAFVLGKNRHNIEGFLGRVKEFNLAS